MKNLLNIASKGFVLFGLYIFIGIIIINTNNGGSLSNYSLFRFTVKPINVASELLSKVRRKGITNMFRTDKIFDESVESLNHLSTDLFLVHTSALPKDGIRLINLRDDSQRKICDIPDELIDHNINSRHKVAIDIVGKRILLFRDGGNKLAVLDFEGNVLVLKEYGFVLHHRIKINNGRIFCTVRRNKKITSSSREVKDEGFVEFNLDGEIKQQFWMSEHLDQIAKLTSISSLVGYTSSQDDPFHVNDVELVCGSTFTEANRLIDNDVLLSVRNFNSIIQIRNDSVFRVFQGKWNLQHDVDILNDSTLSIFNNNSAGTYVGLCDKFHSSIINYNINTGLCNEFLLPINHSTRTEGQVQLLSDGSRVIEVQNHGLIVIYDKDGELIYSSHIRSKDGEYNEMLNWAPILEFNPF